MGFDCVERSHVGLRRKLNEDAVVSLPEIGLWAVADGMGGHDAGEVASAKVVEALSSLATESGIEALVQNAISALQQVNRDLIEMARSGPEKTTIGSTVIGLAIAEGRYRCFWAGDSRGYLVRKGSITQLSRDHSLVQDLVEAGMLEAAEAETHPNANVITRAVGAAPKLEIEIIGGEVNDGDIFLLASDGLTRQASPVELLAPLYTKSIDQAADELIDLALSRGAPDNVSLVIVSVR